MFSKHCLQKGLAQCCLWVTKDAALCKSALFKVKCFSTVQVILSALIQDFSAMQVFLSALFQGSALCKNFQDFLDISAIPRSGQCCSRQHCAINNPKYFSIYFVEIGKNLTPFSPFYGICNICHLWEFSSLLCFYICSNKRK